MDLPTSTLELFVVTVMLTCAATAGSYDYDSDYLVPNQCTPCDAKSCPQLTYCAGVVVKDHCGCCNRCSSDLFQPHARTPVKNMQPELSTSDDNG